jgi:hypothetical protein
VAQDLSLVIVDVSQSDVGDLSGLNRWHLIQPLEPWQLDVLPHQLHQQALLARTQTP